MRDEEFYLEATTEVEGDSRDPALWAKVMTLSNGDEKKAKYEYIRLRVKYLIEETKTTDNNNKNSNSSNENKRQSQIENTEIPNNKDIEISDDDLIEKYGISFNGETYQYGQYRYKKLNDAINYAKTDKTKSKPTLNSNQNNISTESSTRSDIGFQWWLIWAWLGLTLGNIYTFNVLPAAQDLAVVLMILNSILMVMILRYNKYAFLIATILSLNPLLWIINGLYLKSRWNHEKLN